jgi:Na+/H+ antiporter NhaD/arsenite permease-like protein
MILTFIQISVIICFIGLVIVLFFEDKDYIFYSILLITIAGIISATFLEEARNVLFYIDVIEWEVVIFLIAMFVIIEILKEKRFFDEIAMKIVRKFSASPRKMFYVICITSTLMASIVEDLSIAMIFGPIIIVASRKLNLTAAPFLLGMTICINIAATLTPFGSAPNILISTEFNLDFMWFISRIGIYFLITLVLTLLILDKIILKKEIIRCQQQICIPEEMNEKAFGHNGKKMQINFYKNMAALIVFIILLIFISEIFLAGILGALIFLILNPIKNKKEKNTISLSYYLNKADYRLIFFFVCLFVFVGLMQLNGTIAFFELLLESISAENELFLAFIILIVTSLLSGFLDNTPVAIIFIPIISILLGLPEFHKGPLMVAFILGINLGGNFLPQGSAADMMTLQIAQENEVSNLSYRRLTKVGAFFALFHILLGMIYLILMVIFF